MPRQGEAFHRLVERLERAVADHPNVTIESPKFLPDKVTGQLREHDIVLTQHSPQREITTAIECRDRSRPVTVNQIEEFHAKCQDTGVNKGVIVSRVGFRNTARKKADHYDIDCLTFAQVEYVDWYPESDIVIRQRELKHTNLTLGVPLSLEGKNARLFLHIIDGPDEEIDLRIVAGDGQESIIEGRAANLVQPLFLRLPDPTSELAGTERIEITNVDAFYFVDDEGTEHPLKQLQIEFTWEAVETMSPLTFHHYGAEIEKPAFRTITTDIEAFGTIQGKMMIIQDQERRIRLGFVPEKREGG